MLTDTTSAIIAFSSILALFVSLLLSPFIIFLYKRAVIKGMGFNIKVTASKVEVEPQLNKTFIQDPEFIVKNPQEELSMKSLIYGKLQNYLNKNLMIYALSNFCFGFGWAFLYFEADLSHFSINQFLFMATSFCWPFVFSVNSIWARGYKQILLTYGIYIILLHIGMIYFYFHQIEKLNYFNLFLPFLLFNTFPSIIILLLRFNRIKTISLVIFLFCFSVALLSYYIRSFVANNDSIAIAYIEFVSPLGFLNVDDYSLLVIISALLSVIVAFFVILALRKLYQVKYINQQQLYIDAQLLIFTADYATDVLTKNQSITIAFYCLLPFLVHKIVSTVLFKVLKTRSQNKNVVKLLLLRVFALRKASRVSFEKIQVHWQFAGPVLMISGPDLATTTVDTREIIDFVTNNLRRHFCRDKESFEKNVKSADLKPDEDGSFRVSEFFCRNNLWKEVLIELVSMSNVVLLDLRSFTERYKGCQYEIQQLVNYMPLSKVVVLIDKQTDMEFLKTTFINACKSIADSSPNLSNEKPQVYLYSFQAGSDKNFSNLLRLLCNVSEK